ncbi:MAG: Aspartyl/glutamyl-tRNA(Asn/Gln) amidotransferase subunit B [Parcubacteria group bacterium GW2011_GWC1_39_29]|uniref:Aspartyl/glutamyl-tRNA(Asn/Gln) amidotransferase subunit B n=1 Tax=Candidatus Yanofskybacteria bacterium GW2011_GWD1_39_16 TaxID=1619030 RepID=A0A837HQF9_9BACT|nr:MAG: Aspartyl/glutamyl-tRNA(Asn/Gln) amidotransferase subunit B [Candidatus Yanofskybacteria bacterium GW2011_GWD1_39_16]KKR14965.1 MAG: Aspartyl/glutamyl-tRNA(Asn/Gln) amidotransferase subunit B [Parcubacteria group bacterium GW2011_GWC1_39_29]
MDAKYKPVIGLEIHVELKTETKMFCSCKNDPNEKRPNQNICPICMGHPGTLPVANKRAIEKTVMAGLGLNCQIEKDTFFERKNYFYPDLPKGYQITQYQKPFCYGGYLELGGKKFRITRIHLEEDAGRLNHPAGANYSLVDYNRAGMPLMELVTEPDFENGPEVKAFAEELQLVLRYLNVSDADMEKGLMRVEVNISLIGDGGKWGTKVEIKNLNSIKAAADSVDFEIKRQKELLEAGEKIIQETRGWDENKKETISQRVKEEANDYRYFPEPDLPPVHITEEWMDLIKAMLVELPSQRRLRFRSYGLNDQQIEVFTISRHLGDYYEHVATELNSSAQDYHHRKGLKGVFPSEPGISGKLHSLSANYIITEFPPLLGLRDLGLDDIVGLKISPESFSELMVLVFHKEISSTGAKIVLKEMAETGLHPEQIVKDKDLGQVSDSGELEVMISKTLETNTKAVEDYKAGKEASLKFLIGMVMRESKGKADPQAVEEIIKNKLK